MSQLTGGTPKYFVAIDFGTYGSGFSYSAKSDGDVSPRTYEHWPAQRGTPAAKTRTALLYKLSDMSTPQAWGWEAVSQYADLPQVERVNFRLFESFKKYLMPDDFEGLPFLPSGLTVLKMVSDFLHCLVNEVVLPTLRDHYGRRFSPSLVRWCLTVPAGLSQASMDIMRKAALSAGIIPSLQSPSLLLATEPEAAALTAQQQKDLLGLTHGSRLLVLDLGGGTVDMTLHSVDTPLGDGGDISLSEVTYRECLAEGATRVDERFQKHLASALGSEACAEWANDPANAPDVQGLLYDEWGTCKRTFAGPDAMHVNLPSSLVYAVPDDVVERLEATGASDRLTLSGETMASFFTPSLDAIANKALAMLARGGGADVIVLVGGFSSSRFVASYLKARLQADTSAQVVAPHYAATAVLEGGVWFARYPGAIVARRANMSYGIRTAVPWRPGAPDRTWIEHRQAFRCRYGFKPYVRMDELIRTGSKVTHTFQPLYPNQSGVTFDIYGCLSKGARYTTEQTMTKIATVHVEFPAPCGDPDNYSLTAEFKLGETQISVRCVDEQTGTERSTTLQFDSSELLGKASGCDIEA